MILFPAEIFSLGRRNAADGTHGIIVSDNPRHLYFCCVVLEIFNTVLKQPCGDSVASSLTYLDLGGHADGPGTFRSGD